MNKAKIPVKYGIPALYLVVLAVTLGVGVEWMLNPSSDQTQITGFEEEPIPDPLPSPVAELNVPVKKRSRNPGQVVEKRAEQINRVTAETKPERPSIEYTPQPIAEID